MCSLDDDMGVASFKNVISLLHLERSTKSLCSYLNGYGKAESSNYTLKVNI